MENKEQFKILKKSSIQVLKEYQEGLRLLYTKWYSIDIKFNKEHNYNPDPLSRIHKIIQLLEKGMNELYDSEINL